MPLLQRNNGGDFSLTKDFGDDISPLCRLRLHPLYNYAARNWGYHWGYHARAASTKVERLTLNLLEGEKKVTSSSRAMTASIDYSDHGLEVLGVALLKNEHHSDWKDTYGRAPLLLAAENGHEAGGEAADFYYLC